MNRFIPSVLLLVLAAILIGGSCNSIPSSDSGGEDGSEPPLRGTYWQIDSFAGHDEALNDVQSSLVLNIDTTSFEGEAACNTFIGSYQVTEKNVDLNVEFISEKGCVGRVDYERALTSALESVNAYEIDGRMLVLRQDEEEVLRFTAGKKE